MAKQTFTTGQVLTAAQMTSLQQTAMGGGSTTAKTTSYVLVAADAGTVVQMNSASATTITVNTGLFAAGDTVQIQNVGSGVCTVTAGTATVSTSAVLALKQYDAGSLYFNSTSAALFFAADAADGASPLTTKGDLYTYSTADARLAVGTNGQTLVADSSTATGLKWATASSTPTASGCQLRKSADQNITNNTLTTLTFDAEDFDTNSYHSLVTNTERITVPSTGYYLVNLQVMFATNTSGYRQIGLFKNGTRLNYQNAFATNGSTEAINVFNLMLSLTASDYLEIKVIQNSGGGVFVYGDNTNTRGTLFGITYLGA